MKSSALVTADEENKRGNSTEGRHFSIPTTLHLKGEKANKKTASVLSFRQNTSTRRGAPRKTKERSRLAPTAHV